MKKSFIVFSFLLFFANCFASENKNFSIEIKPSFGMIFGRASEYVHVDYEKFLDVGSYNARLSQLDYDYKAPCVNLDIDSQIFKHFYIGCNLSFGIPIKAGNMQDYDWLNVYFPNHEWANALTNYSIHDNYLNSYIDLNLKCGYSFYLPFNISLTPFVGLSYDCISFSAKDGYGKYGKYNGDVYEPNTESFDKIDFSGDVIQYKQYSSGKMGGYAPSVNLGLKYLFNVIPRINISGSFLFFPFYSVSSLDYHVLRNQDFLSVVNRSFKFSTDLTVCVKINKLLCLGVKGDFTFIPELCGSTYSKSHQAQNYFVSKDTQSRIARISGQVSFVLGFSF